MVKIKGTVPQTPKKTSVLDKIEEEISEKNFEPGISVDSDPEEGVESEEKETIEDKSEKNPQKEGLKQEKVLVRCPDCPWKAGLKDENTYCGTCNGSGQVPADPLE